MSPGFSIGHLTPTEKTLFHPIPPARLSHLSAFVARKQNDPTCRRPLRIPVRERKR